MIQVAVLSRDARLDEALRSTGLRAGRVDPQSLAAYTQSDAPPAVVVVDVREQLQLPAGLPAFRKRHPGTGIVLVLPTFEPRLMLEAMRAGVNECVQEPVTAQALDQAVRRVMVDTVPQAAGQLYVFVGAKGGVGTTTVAVNTAAMLARLSGEEVLLIDLHVGYGDAAIFLGVEPRFSVLDALEHVNSVDESFFRSLVEKTRAGVHLMGASDRLPEGALDASRARALLDVAIHTYRFTVLDVPRLDAVRLDALELATVVVVVTSQELSSLKSAGRLARTLRMRCGASRVKAVINRVDRRAEIAPADIERVIGDSVRHFIPSNYRVAIEALNLGRPMALDRTALTAAFGGLAGDLGGLEARAARKPSGVFGRLAFRRA